MKLFLFLLGGILGVAINAYMNRKSEERIINEIKAQIAALKAGEGTRITATEQVAIDTLNKLLNLYQQRKRIF